VTIVFCDLVGSTALGERLDAESVRYMMVRYFEQARRVIERHGGTVEKFVGDAVMAVFGVPVVHEDDALRAVRAAAELRDAVELLNLELERSHGERLQLRIGVNTGEVVTVAEEWLVTGDAVNVAARLEQAADPDEVLLGEPTYSLVRNAVRAEAVQPLVAKGKSEPLAAYRLFEVSAFGQAPLRAGTPVVGRGGELALLEREFDAVLTARRCRLVTVVGEPGVGKSRLAAELVEAIGARARVVRGACLSYGEGITYWAIAEIVRELAGIRLVHSAEQARQQIQHTASDRIVAAKIAQLLGLTEGVATVLETAWAVRQFLAAGAAEHPLVVLVDDIHWAEPALLDVLETLPGSIGEAPILAVCLARPELFESRPDWKPTVTLEPLGEADVTALLAKLLPDAPAGMRERLAAASAGNPLFAEELAAWALEGEFDSNALPTSLTALLGARIDRLDVEARDALERAAIEGELFHRGAVVELSAPESRSAVPGQIEALVDKELVRSAPASFVGEAAFRFKHILVRDAAYRATAKKLRAALHEQFANWLERLLGGRATEYEEILGYHLEQSYRYHAELGPVGDNGRALGERSASRLASAGQRAFARGDVAAATNLLQRATVLLPPGSRERIELLPDLVEALFEEGRLGDAEAVVDEGIELADALEDERLSALLRTRRGWLKVRIDPRGSSARALSETEQAISIFERLGDDLALALAWDVVTEVHALHGHGSAERAAAERGLLHAERARDERRQGHHRRARTATARHGSVHLDDVQEMIDDDLAWARQTGNLWLEALGIAGSALVHAARGDAVKGKELAARSMSIVSDLGIGLFPSKYLGSYVWWLTDDPVAAEAQLRESRDALVEAGEQGLLSLIAAHLAEALYRQGRYDEAEEMLSAAVAAGAEDDVGTQLYVRFTQAKLLARNGQVAEAEALAAETVALGAETDYVDWRCDSLLALGEVLRLNGRPSEAAQAIQQALDLWIAKGNVMFASRARALLAGLDASASAPT
jgi:class 3 adenylate cyclase/tetratricopeptide (TPR) repeat protein